MNRKLGTLCGVWAALVCADVRAEAISYQPTGRPDVTLTLPAPARGSLVVGDRAYVALGAAGVAIYRLEGTVGTLVETRAVDGEATGVVLIDGQPWVLRTTLSAAPLLTEPRSAAPSSQVAVPAGKPAAPTPDQAPLTARGGTVVDTSVGTAVIDQGRDSGLTPRTAVRFLSQQPVAGLEGGDGLMRDVEVGFGVVEATGAGRSQVVLSRGSRTKQGDRFEVLSAVPASVTIAPPRLSDYKEASVTFRPFLAVGNLGVGMVTELGLAYHGKGDWFGEVRAQPVSAALTRDGNLLGASLLAAGGYDHRFFAIGLGLGITAANTGVTEDQEEYSYAEDGGVTTESRFAFESTRKGVSVAQVARLGSLDGLHLELRNTFVLAGVNEYQQDCVYDESVATYSCGELELVDQYQEFRWGATEGSLVVPMASATDLKLEVGGGATGYFHVGLGLQSWLTGNGDKGSLGLSVAAGYGFIAGSPDDQSVEAGGPLVSVGVRRRF